MKKQFLFLVLLGLLCSIGNVWGVEETLTWAFSGINTACTDPSGITKSSTNASSTIQSSMAASFSNVKTKSDASLTGYSSRLQRTDKTNLGDNNALVEDQYVGASFTIPSGYVFKLKTISFPYCALSTTINARLTISDGETEVSPSDGSASSGGTATISYNDADKTKELSGNVTVKIWFWMPSSTSTGKYAGLGDLAITGDLVESSSAPVAVTGITIAPSSKTIKVGRTVTLAATITPSNATDKAVTWAVTSGGTYASVDESGLVTGLAAGTAVVTATAHDGSGVTQTATITVEECPTSGTIFSMDITASSGTTYTGNNTFPALIDATYIGGEAYSGSKTSTNRTATIDSNKEYPFSANSELAIKIVMDCDLEEGDIIEITTSSSKQIKIQKVVGTDLYKTASKKFTIPAESSLIGENVFYLLRDNSESTLGSLTVTRPIYRTITLEYNDGATADGSLKVIDGEKATKPSDPTWENHRFDGWYNGESAYNWSTEVTGDITLTAHWTQLYTVTFAEGDEGASGTMTPLEYAEGVEVTIPECTFTAPAGKAFTGWVVTKTESGDAVSVSDGKFTMPAEAVTVTAQWNASYAITKGAHEHGDFTISPESQAAGEEVTLTATPNFKYVLSSWSVYKTGEPATTVTVTDNQFTMPAYAVTVDATFASDPKKQVLYLTSDGTVNADDKLFAALAEDYTVTKAAYNASKTVTDFDLVVFHESIGGGNYNSGLVAAAIAADVPVLNTKSYFYTKGSSARWGWGTPNAGKSVTGATLNPAYGNTVSHPIFEGVTISNAGFITLFSSAKAKAMQPVTDLVSGKEGYTLALTPNADSGNGVAIHELTPTQRGVSSAKYLMVSIGNENGCFEILTANGQRLLKNAAAYLIDNTASWTPTNSVTGTITAAGWSTFSSFANLDLSDITGGAAYYASAASGTTVTLSPTTATVPAGEGLMIKGTAGETFTIGVAASGTAITGNLLKGQTTTGNVAASTSGAYHYVFGFKKPEEVVTEYGFYNLNAATSVPAGKAYLETEDALTVPQNGAPAVIRILDEENNATSIERIDGKNDAIKFIENGQLYILREGVVYDALGRKVR